MKIPLNSGSSSSTTSGPAARAKALEKDIQAARKGDWEARHRVERQLMPLLTSLAKKRASDNTEINKLIEAGKSGIATAIKKVKPGLSGDRFQIFALPFIEGAMDKPAKGGLLQKLFGK